MLHLITFPLLALLCSTHMSQARTVTDINGGSDIIPPPLTSGAVLSDNRWPNAKIPYIIASNFTANQKSVIKKAIAVYNKNTCIRFIPRTNEKDYISIVNIGGCTSNIGRLGIGAQHVTLGSGCAEYVGVVEHELMHAAGFSHTQHTYDRDNYIYVNYDNVNSGSEWAFSKDGPENGQLLGVPYDTQSIMHYSNAFQKDPNVPVMVAFDGSHVGSKDVFTKLDLLDLNRLYNCDANDCWNSTSCYDGLGPLKWTTSNFGQFVYANGCDFYGSDYASNSTSSHEICRGLCLKDLKCTHITWAVMDKMCYLKAAPIDYPMSIPVSRALFGVCGFVNIRSPPN